MGKTVGTFTVEFEVLDPTTGKPIEEEYLTPLGLEGDAYMVDSDGEYLYDKDGEKRVERACPVVSNKKPYTGALTAHELQWVSSLPGKEYNFRYRFKVTPATPAPAAG